MQEFEQNSSAFVSVLKKCSQVRKKTPHRVGLLVRVSASHVLGPWFAPWPGHTKDLHKNGTNCLPAWHACVWVGVWQCSPTVLKLKGLVVCGTVYEDMHLKDLLGSIPRYLSSATWP